MEFSQLTRFIPMPTRTWEIQPAKIREQMVGAVCFISSRRHNAAERALKSITISRASGCGVKSVVSFHSTKLLVSPFYRSILYRCDSIESECLPLDILADTEYLIDSREGWINLSRPCQSSSVVEQRTHKPLVAGSTPASGTTSKLFLKTS